MKLFFNILYLFLNLSAFSVTLNKDTQTSVENFLIENKCTFLENPDLPPDEWELLKERRINKVMQYYEILFRYGFVKNPLNELKKEDLICLENLYRADASWNKGSSLEENKENLANLVALLDEANSHMGELCIRSFLFTNSANCRYIWVQTPKRLSEQELEKSYSKFIATAHQDPSSNHIFVVNTAPLENAFRNDINTVYEGQKLIRLDNKTYQRELLYIGQFIPSPRNWDLKQTQLFKAIILSGDAEFPFKAQFNGKNITITQLQDFVHLATQLNYAKGKNAPRKTISLLWPTNKTLPRSVILDHTLLSHVPLLFRFSSPAERPLLLSRLTDNLKLTRQLGTYKTQSSPEQIEQVLIVELSYYEALEITEDTFTRMQIEFSRQAEKFWESTDLAGTNLTSIDLLIIKQNDGNKIYIPRNTLHQILPTYMIGISEPAIADKADEQSSDNKKQGKKKKNSKKKKNRGRRH